MNIVIGSGPAGIAAAHALVEQGLEVTILDVGKRPERAVQDAINRMAARDPSEWTDEDVERAVQGDEKRNDNCHPKRVFGSDFCFAGSDSPTRVRWEGDSGFKHSDARGGLSRVWGAALLPYREEDIAGWPIGLAELEPHYKEVLRFVPASMVRDSLEKLLPLYTDKGQDLAPSRQAEQLLSRLRSHEGSLANRGISFGRSRLAIRSHGDGLKRGCEYCRMCLSGCPYSLIYSSEDTLDDLIAAGRVTYLGGHSVIGFEEGQGGVDVYGGVLGGGSFRMSADRVFLGAGVLPTAAIVLRSLGRYDQPVKLRDSQYFVLPLLSFRGVPGVERERMHASAQAFVEIDEPKISAGLVHLQIYGYSEVVARELMRTLLRWPLKFRRFRNLFLGRLLVAQAFLHSDESGAIDLVLKRLSEDSDEIVASVSPVHRGKKVASKVGWKLVKESIPMGMVPFVPAMRFAVPGRGYHSGGSFPMAINPGPGETDRMGRLVGMRRVHLIDSSIFPTIPATSITLSVMANAHRIASMVACDEFQ